MGGWVGVFKYVLLPNTMLKAGKNSKFSIIIFALHHNEFKNIKEKTLESISNKDTIIFDLTNTLSGSNIYNL